MKIKENIPISTLTTMRLGGPARYVIEIESKDDILKAYDFAREKNLPIFVLGFGANTIGHDEGFNGVIITSRLKSITLTGDVAGGTPAARSRQASTVGETATAGPVKVTAMSGELWDDVVAYTCKLGLTGIEALSKIPSLAGAAPVQNIGAYGQEVADTLIEIEVFDSTDNTFKILQKSDLHFSYRKSILNTTEKGRYFVVSITLELKPGQMSRPFYNSIERYIESNHCTDFSPQGIREIVSTIRADKLPDPAEKASSGSFFKNIYLDDEEAKTAELKGYPVYHGHDGNKINSGWLIEEAGLKGTLIHGMRVCDKATLVLINESAESYQDLASARTKIQNAVQEKFGYQLEQEPEEIK